VDEELVHEVELLVPVQELTYLGLLPPQVLEPVELDWGISTSFETTLNFNNFAKLFNKTPRCLNPFYNKLALEIHNWLS